MSVHEVPFKPQPDPDVVLIENAGHWPQFEQPDAVNRAMLDFLGRGDR